MDKWVAECIPCGWYDFYDSEQSAIGAAEFHVMHIHPDVPPEKRGALKMGHVQLRTIVTAAETVSQSPATVSLLDGKGVPSDIIQGDAGAGAHGNITITTPKGETITVKE